MQARDLRVAAQKKAWLHLERRAGRLAVQARLQYRPYGLTRWLDRAIVTTIMTTSVGIRELKRDGAQLVRRAASGEQIEITRYGKPAARLVPIDVGQTGDQDDAWMRERRAFERLEPKLRRSLMGLWVVVQGGRVVRQGADPRALARRTLRGGVDVPFFIGRVGALPEHVELPGFEVER